MSVRLALSKWAFRTRNVQRGNRVNAITRALGLTRALRGFSIRHDDVSKRVSERGDKARSKLEGAAAERGKAIAGMILRERRSGRAETVPASRSSARQTCDVAERRHSKRQKGFSKSDDPPCRPDDAKRSNQ